MNVIVIGGGLAGCLTALALAEEGHQVTIVEAEKAEDEDNAHEKKRRVLSLLKGTSNNMPGREGLGFHFIDLKTAIENLKGTIALVRAYPSPAFQLGGDSAEQEYLRRGRYFIVEDTLFHQEKIVTAYKELQEVYRQLCQEDAANQIFGEPDRFVRELEPHEYADVSLGKPILAAFETAERVLNWPVFKAHIQKQILENPCIDVICNAHVSSVTPIERSGQAAKFEVIYSDKEKKPGPVLFADKVVNCSWQNIEALNKTLNIEDPKGSRTNRVKVMIQVKLPDSLVQAHSMLFCFGPHAGLTNLGNGTGFVTYEPETNVHESKDLELPADVKSLFEKGQDNPELQEIGKQILAGAVKYLPDLRDAEIIHVSVGVVRTYGKIDIHSADSAVHARAQSGVRERQVGYLENGAMKFVYCVTNAALVAKLMRDHCEGNAQLDKAADSIISDNRLLGIKNRERLRSAFLLSARHQVFTEATSLKGDKAIAKWSDAVINRVKLNTELKDMNEKLRDHINEARMTLGYMVNILIRYGKTVDLLQFEECEPQSIAALNVFYRELRKENQRIQSLYNKYTEQELENTKKNKFARFQPSSADSHCNMSLQAFLLSYFSLFPAGSCDAKSRVEGGPRLKRSATVGALGKVFSNTMVGSLFSQSATCIVPYSDLQAKTERRQHRQSISTTV